MSDTQIPRADAIRRGVVSIPIYRLDELRALEVVTARGLPPGELMRRAATAAARLTLQLCGERGGPICVLVGPGNNGGDALMTAAILHRQGLSVRTCFLDKPERFHGEAAAAFREWNSLGISREPAGEEGLERLFQSSMVIDGLFGIGLSRPLDARAKQWIVQVNTWQQQSGLPVLALDIPSGINADTGSTEGGAIKATHTISFLGASVGLFTGDGPGLVGIRTIESLGSVESGIASGVLIDPSLFSAHLKPRPSNSNKGLFGSLGILAGARGMRGAALLASRMALFGGTGRVFVNAPGGDAPALDALHPELMWRDSLDGVPLTATVAGPGLGDADYVYDALESLLRRGLPTILDADALNALSRHPELKELARNIGAPLIVTPHPLEAARLLATKVEAVQGNRIEAALQLARALQSIVILKGCGTVVARPEGSWAINPTGNPGLATGGTGDVLAGLVGALLAQGWSAWAAALGAAWMHGAAADSLVLQGVGPIGLTASELIPAIRDELNRLVSPGA